MKKKIMSKDFSKLYTSGDAVFGKGPEPLLVTFTSYIPRTAPVLDIGCGQGRNTLYLARRGFSVVGIDTEPKAVEQTEYNAKKSGLKIVTEVTSFQDFIPESRWLDAVLAFGLIPVLSRKELSLFVTKVMEWTQSGSIIFVTAFTSDDPSFEPRRDQCKQIDKLSFILPDGRTRSYLAPGEITGIFEDVEILHHWEGLGPWHRHGNNKPERHAWARLAAKRK